MKNVIRSCLAAVPMMVAAAGAQAAPSLNFDIAGHPYSNIITSISDCTAWLGFCTLSTTMEANLDSEIFSLEEGESHTFDFFDVTVGEGLFIDGTGWIAATLGFDLPTGVSVTGVGEANWITIAGAFNGGTLEWYYMPALVTLSDGSSFEVSFSDIHAFGFGNTATVQATVKAIHVPEPLTLGLLGTGLAGLGLLRRRAQA